MKVFTNNLWFPKNPKGIWRKTTLTSYQSPTTEWITVLDVDELARKEEVSHIEANAHLLILKIFVLLISSFSMKFVDILGMEGLHPPPPLFR